MKANEIILEKFQGCLAGVAIGDALGMPVEMMSDQEIIQAIGNHGVQGYLAPIQKKIRGTGNLKPGDTTDDWQLTEVVAKSLLNLGAFDPVHLAKMHVLAMEKTRFGWGKTTAEAVAELRQYFESGGRQGRSPFTVPDVKEGNRGAGNGVAMKVAPLALFAFDSDEKILRNLVRDLGYLTHSDTRSWLSAYAVARIISRVLSQTQDIFDHTVSIFLLKDLLEEIDGLEVERKVPSFTAKLATLYGILGTRGDSEYELFVLKNLIGTGGICVDSVVFSIGVFLRHPIGFENGVLEAVNAGGDTDTNAAMAGAMIGANIGLSGIPKKLIDGCPSAKEAIVLGQKFFELITKE
ncbi:MAG: ADP-ribosylglycohydrolase family protein [Patescibacteria group bacterium]|nr:ADP-ribosylglycohydrolase family protein [Patescibacteria group bacterium]